MSNIDKQALRNLAVAAKLAPSWYAVGEFGDVVDPAKPEWKPVHEFCKTFTAERVLALLDELEAKDKRIAELEAREVKLPNPHAHLIWIQAGHAPDDYWDDVAVSHSEKDKCCDGSDRYPVYTLWEIKEALSAIGINIAAAGKGE